MKPARWNQSLSGCARRQDSAVCRRCWICGRSRSGSLRGARGGGVSSWNHKPPSVEVDYETPSARWRSAQASGEDSGRGSARGARLSSTMELRSSARGGGREHALSGAPTEVSRRAETASLPRSWCGLARACCLPDAHLCHVEFPVALLHLLHEGERLLLMLLPVESL